MSTEFEGRRLAQADLTEVKITDEVDGSWICGLCVLKLEGTDQNTYGPTVSIDIAAPFLPGMSKLDGELALFRRAREVMLHLSGFSVEHVQSRMTPL
jgi:hypothetical protein